MDDSFPEVRHQFLPYILVRMCHYQPPRLGRKYQLDPEIHITAKIKKKNLTQKIAVSNQKFEQCGFTRQICIQKMQTEGQTVYPDKTALDLTICPDLSV